MSRLTWRNPKDGKTYLYGENADVVGKLADYEEIGTVSEFRELKEKATAKKPIDVIGYGMMCPHCNSFYLSMKRKHCGECGGLIDWSEGKE